MTNSFMKKLLTLISLVSSAVANAQHCPFDFSAIVVLNIHTAGGAGIIPGLKIYMTDSTGAAVMRGNYRNGKWVSDTLWFWQNPEKTTFTGYIDNENPAEEEKIRFPFAKDNYVCVVARDFPLSKYTIVIKEANGSNVGKFMAAPLKLRDSEAYPLCGTYDDEVYKSRCEGVIFHPAEVVLKP